MCNIAISFVCKSKELDIIFEGRDQRGEHATDATLKSQKALTAVSLHVLQLLREVDDDVVIVEEGGEGPVDDLGGERRVWTDVGEEEGGAERFVLLLDL